jgi:GTP-binding protein
MPGYGYARVARSQSAAWTRLVREYLTGRPNLRRVYLLVDSRRGPGKSDSEFFELLDKAAVSYQVLLTKSDAPKREELARTEADIMAALKRRPAAHPEVLTTSAVTGLGIDRLRAEIATVLAPGTAV